ncbi:DNA sulfur modification protein DndE [Phorcysia thermohydrogeniphila]|uniref:DNA sulfur modification protein DndE n=1 Tax=Phorcysia thermohydrogeniphila TaxID=936138 RepID=A0A4R1G5J5_9BACT|nr:DNA sulfur modification protein DndE [Phorcysia thermohydrogeniphila]TCK02904.1 DNA sulfur modification protein DndE [Phorcysia thermohydrogeniphila]
MKFNRIILDKKISQKLFILKGRTGLTPNILCRFGLILSLKDPTVPDPKWYKQDGQELMRHVLLGDLDTILICLFKQRAYRDGVNLKDEKLLLELFRAHINRGAELLYNRIKNLSSIKELIDL